MKQGLNHERTLPLIMIRFVLDPKKITIAGIMEMGGMPGRPLTLNFS